MMRYKKGLFMNLERKEIYVGTVDRKNKEIALRRDFGWSYVEDTHRGRSHVLHIVLSRNKDMKNYSLIAKLEEKHDKLQEQIKTYFPITDSPEMFLLILLLIFPFVLYCVYKSNQKKEIASNNAKLMNEMKKIRDEARVLL